MTFPGSGPSRRSRRGRALLLTALVFGALYAVPLYFPPATTSSAPPPPQATLVARLFPGVPGWWVAGRLICLLAAMAFASMAMPPHWSWFATSSAPAAAIARDVKRGWMWTALGVAAGHVAAGWWVDDFPRGLQLAYVALLAVPAALLWIATPRHPERHSGSGLWRNPAFAMTALLIVAWWTTRLFAAWHSPRTADLVDAQDAFNALMQGARPEFNILTHSYYPGFTALPVVIQGAGILGWKLPLSLESVQLVHLAWMAVCGAGIAWIAAQMVGAWAAPVAAAVFLFAPLELVVPMWAVGAFTFAVYTAGLLALTLRIERTGSPAAIAAFGALAGVASACLPLVLVVPVLAVYLLWRTRIASAARPVLLTAILSFCAALRSSLAQVTSLADALRTHAGGKGSWQLMEAALFGQLSPQDAEGAIKALRHHALDVPLGLLMAPFATPRTAVRLWGDAILDPIGAALAAIGLAVTIKAMRASPTARLLLAVLVAALLPGVASSYDRPSLLRVAAAGVPLALLAGAGFETLRCVVAPRFHAGALTALTGATIALGGTVLFDFVNARILARSPLGIIESELKKHPEVGDAVVLEEAQWKPRYLRARAEHGSVKPIEVWSHTALADLERRTAPLVVFWSPAEEDEYAVSQRICRAWPGAALYELRDDAGLTKIFAGSRVPVSAWGARAGDCPAALDTEAARAERAIARAHALARSGQHDRAAVVLEEQARRTFGYAKIFDAVARALLVPPVTASEADRAVKWSARACETKRGGDPWFCSTVASALAASARFQEAASAAQRAGDAAMARGDRELATMLESRARDYAHAAAGRVAGVASVNGDERVTAGEPPTPPTATYGEGRDVKSRDLAGADLAGADLRGKQLEGAVLRGANLARAKMAGVDLRAAILAGADLSGADLGGAQLAKADLSAAILKGANARGADLKGAVLSDADLREVDFGDANLDAATLTGARLMGANFSGAKLIEANLSRAELRGAVFAGAYLRNATLDGADLRGVDLGDTDFAGVNLGGARLNGADLSGLILRDVKLTGADLTGANLEGADLGAADLRGAKLVNALLRRTRLANAVLAGADLSGAILENADLSAADMTAAVLAATSLSGAILNGAKLDRLVFREASLEGVELVGARLAGATLSDARLSRSNLRDCDLRGADLARADMRDASLAGCDLTGATFAGASLQGVDLRGATLDKANLEKVNLANQDLGNQRMRRVNLRGASLAAANLAGADLAGADLSEADLQDATLADADLSGASLRGAKLGEAMLSGADLSGALLDSADMSRAYLIDVTWSLSRCPDGSLSSEHGETCCGYHVGVAPASCSP